MTLSFSVVPIQFLEFNVEPIILPIRISLAITKQIFISADWSSFIELNNWRYFFVSLEIDFSKSYTENCCPRELKFAM